MTDVPFGFGLPGGGGGGGNPDDLSAAAPLFAELQKLMSAQSGPVNWELARQMAVAQVAGSDQQLSTSDSAVVIEAVRLADLWLDPVTTLPSGVRTAEAWTRVDWVSRTLPAWGRLCDPVAERVVGASAGALPEEVRAQAGPLLGVMSQLGGLMFGAQVGQGIAQLAGEVLSATEIGLPLGPAGVAALVPANVAAFGEGLDRPDDEVRLFLALREAAHHRLFEHVPWLRQHLFDAVGAYARGITVDPSAIERAMSEVDPSNPESLQQALAGGLFEPQTTPEQQTALARLETSLALVDGWVDEVTAAAAGEHLPGTPALRETLRRRRASGGPAEQTFATLVGLELRPRRLREASALWRAVGAARGTDGRDALWGHPDLMPSAEDLDDPEAFAARRDDDQPELPE